MPSICSDGRHASRCRTRAALRREGRFVHGRALALSRICRPTLKFLGLIYSLSALVLLSVSRLPPFRIRIMSWGDSPLIITSCFDYLVLDRLYSTPFNMSASPLSGFAHPPCEIKEVFMLFCLLLKYPISVGSVPQAQHNLALCLLTGVGAEKDLEAALEWYLKAAEQVIGPSN